MNITGIITEYNPFHKGHLYHLNSSIKSTNSQGTICIMSGNFVQRGVPALVDKWTRTKMALENGVDLVIELPTFYALSSAEFFAKGSIKILDSLGIVNNLFFGSECGDINKLYLISKTLLEEPSDFKDSLKENLNLGLTYAKAREIALIKTLKNYELDGILKNSNNILGIEYIKNLIKIDSVIKPITFKREGSKYNDKILNSEFSSATSIREHLKGNLPIEDLKKYLPENTYEILLNYRNKSNYVFEDSMFNYIKYRLISKSVNFNNLFEITEGLDNKFLKEIYNSNSYNDLILNIKSKRYTYTKISRLLTQIFLNFDKYSFEELSKEDYLYARVLGFNNVGQKILKTMKNKSSIPIITKINNKDNNPLLNLDIESTALYSLLNKSINPKADYLNSPIIKG
ncbi:nucleotidyltransferase [Clostridium sp.]|uniref:nucleotidyltransferase n=1 Tax=Clostridium sp. TaxID=1506 RepID=UPI00261FC860|nr:nucleotidyltransferase [Clostridium sp.]